ncbi:LOW QUALITY PROTEIN: protein FAM214B-like [Xenopus laevis]|uniref:Atos homolog protein B n=1 Tax=Xenopus laevis TaxID=8355 RepID=A0A8J1M4J7_XENLA|nr:LOW QUALITY PROTEIN: protein FAM214B-like [Xenopus laevis]
MCQGRTPAARHRASHCYWRHRNRQGCRGLWTPWGLSESPERNPIQHLNVHTSRGNSTPPHSLRLNWRLGSAGSMRHIEMDLPPKEEAGADGCSGTAGSSKSSSQDGALDGRHECRVLVGFPEADHQIQRVYHVSIISDVPASKTSSRQTLKRPLPDQLFQEATRSPKRAFWGHPRRDGPFRQSELDGEEEQDNIEDGLLSVEVPLCSSAQHFSHSGLHVTEHRGEASSSRESMSRLRVGQLFTSCQQTDSPLVVTQGALYSNPAEAQKIMPDGLSHTHVGNGTKVSLDNEEYNGTEVELATNQHILDKVLHNIAQPEGPAEMPAQPNGNLSAEPMLKEPLSPQLEAQSEGPSPAETPPGPSRHCTPGGMAVKRKLLPSSESADSCSEDEGQSKKWRAGQGCQALHGACRSTDSKAAPFWNHLLPAARRSQKILSEHSGRRPKRGLHLKSRSLISSQKGPAARSWANSCISRPLLGNFEESILKGRFPPSGHIEGFTAEIGASGSYCPQHVTLPVQVTYFHISEHSVPSPFLGVINLEAVGKKGYSVPSTGTIQVTLFNPNKTVVKMFLVTYDLKDMPPNHMTFLRHRIFLVPVEEQTENGGGDGPREIMVDNESNPSKETARRILCYLMHLRFQRSRSGKIYLHGDIRLLFSRKSIEVDSRIPYELKSFTETPSNPKYSPRV